MDRSMEYGRVVAHGQDKQAASQASVTLIGGIMATRKGQSGTKGFGSEPEVPAKPPAAEFKVYGEEMIEKEVKPSGKTGRVYLPPDWVGKHVKIIRID